MDNISSGKCQGPCLPYCFRKGMVHYVTIGFLVGVAVIVGWIYSQYYHNLSPVIQINPKLSLHNHQIRNKTEDKV
jgi:hypothetical protein